VHPAHFLVVDVDESHDRFLERRHRDVRHLTVVLEKLEEDNLTMLSEGCLDLALGGALGNVGNVKRCARCKDVGGVLGTGLLESMKRRASVVLGQFGSLEAIILGTLNMLVL